ncbi:U3 small nucleolar RNA-associated protein 6-domain-containing protein [Boletus reticuloceps]|uniref:U3 small nucleolar RNA-associated protein 6-domain-containing protein n=1 Tax=Boletus reticuloceps TaxID=495285 RepID=A0A8I2YQZ0_9AGAM|nr:U3 small nucleolar RNA-associated protein 6-domain-containing protein [Boletus reticuloceps]
MLAELKDLVQKGLFSRAEVKEVLKKRTQFETALVRRVAKKSDFLRYAAYEMGLERLRRKRLQRLNLPKSKTTVSDYALVRRQFQIFERALKRFRSDVGLWVQYVQVAKREGAHALVGRITARALQLHPHVPSFYILAASHELAHMSPSAARSLLQRGLRLNSDSVDMWREYIRMELGFIEGMRRRWNVLGINTKDERTEAEKGLGIDIDMNDIAEPVVIDEQRERPPDEVIAAEKGGDEGEAARKAIMDGAIVKSALSSAAKALPTAKLFLELETLIRNYPCQLRLRTTLLDHVYSLLQESLPDDPRAVQMYATRRLREVSLPKQDGKDFSEEDRFADGEKLIDALQSANEQLTTAVRASWRTSMKSDPRAVAHPNMSEIYADFVSEWCRSPTLEPSLVREILDLELISLDDQYYITESRALKFARKYSTGSSSPSVWLARLDAEHACDQGDIRSAWASARTAVFASQDVDATEKVWLWGLDHQPGNAEDQQAVHEDLLHDTMKDSATRTIHDTLLLRYVSETIYSQETDSATRLKLLRHISSAYLPTAPVWERVFTLERVRDELADKSLLRAVYEYWRALDGISATTTWAGWLMDHGDGKRATQVISSAMVQLGAEDKVRLTEAWSSRLTGSQKEDEDEDGDGDASEEEGLPLQLEHV